MSSILVDNLTGKTTAGSIAVTGEGNSTTTNLQQGLTKVWATWDSANNPATLEDSFNTSSLTDVEQGVFQVNINNNMSGAYYSPVGMIRFYHMCVQSTMPSSSVLSLRAFYVTSTAGARGSYDNAFMTAQIAGDLA